MSEFYSYTIIRSWRRTLMTTHEKPMWMRHIIFKKRERAKEKLWIAERFDNLSSVIFFFVIFFCNLHLIHPTIFKTVYKKKHTKQELKMTILIGVPPPSPLTHLILILFRLIVEKPDQHNKNYDRFAFTESLTIENVCMAGDLVPKVQCGNSTIFFFFQLVQYEITKTWILKKREKYKHWEHSKRGSII